MLNEKILACLKQENIEALKILIASAESAEILRIFHDLPSKEQVIVFRLLAKDKALSIFELLDTDDQQNLLRSFTDEQAIEFVNKLAPDDRVKLLDELPAVVAKKMLAALSPKEREMTNLLMGYEAQTAGRIMTPEFVHLHKGITAAMALEQIKIDAVEKETIYTIYITDAKGRLEGAISLRDLLIAKPDIAIEDIMKEISVTVSTGTDQEEVARLLQKMDWLAIPVVDKESRLVGIVTIDDAVDILEDEATEDILTSGGIFARKEADRSEILTNGSLWSIWKVRLPFLFITIIGGMLAAVVLDRFEEVLEAVVVVAFFIPLIMDMGGSVGTQSSTAFARGVVLGHINISKFFNHFAKEIGVGFSIGIITGLISGAIAFIWQGNIMLGLAVGVSLALTVTLASLLGFLVPFVLMKLNADQAAGAPPIITTIKDISGILIYFTFASIFLANMIAAASDYEITEIRATTSGLYFSIDPEEETATVLGRAYYKFDIVIPEEITVMGDIFTVTKIGDGAFSESGLTSLVLPGSIEVIGDNAFRDNLLTHVALPDLLQEIGFRAFMNNELISIFIPSSVIKWKLHPETGQGDHFNNNPLESIYTDLNNASSLAVVLTDEVMGVQTSATTVLFDAGNAMYQRNNLVEDPAWGAVE